MGSLLRRNRSDYNARETAIWRRHLCGGGGGRGEIASAAAASSKSLSRLFVGQVVRAQMGRRRIGRERIGAT